MKRRIALCFVFALLVACSGTGTPSGSSDTGLSSDGGADGSSASAIELGYSFTQDKQGWKGAVTDYPNGSSTQIDFVSEIRPIPENPNNAQGFYLEGMNRPADIFMFIKRKLGPSDGIVAGQRYKISYTIDFSSNYPADCQVDGGELIFLKAGGSTWEPASVLSSDKQQYELNVEKGEGGVGGENATAAGDITHDETCAEAGASYYRITRQHTHSTSILASPDGNLWLLVGIDSGLDAKTSIYFNAIDVTLTPATE